MFSVILNKVKIFKDKNICLAYVLFLAGCVFLAAASLTITIVPYIVNNFIEDAFISIFKIKNASFIFYGLTFVCYLFSIKYSREQIQWVLITFAYYVIFQVLAKIFS